MVTFCETVDADIALLFAEPGQPLVCMPDYQNRIASYMQQASATRRSLTQD